MLIRKSAAGVLRFWKCRSNCFNKFCVGNSRSTLTFIAALCFLALGDTQSSVRYVYGNATSYDMWMFRLSCNKTSKRKVFLGNFQLEHILVYFHNPFQLLFESENKSSSVTRSLSTKSCTHDTVFKYRLSVSLVQDLAEKALILKLDSYMLTHVD